MHVAVTAGTPPISPFNLPQIDLSHNANRAPRYVSLRAEWECERSGGITLGVARVNADACEASVILSQDMMFEATLNQKVLSVKIPDDILVDLFQRPTTTRLGKDAEGFHSFVVQYAVVVNENIELMGPLSIDHKCIPDCANTDNWPTSTSPQIRAPQPQQQQDSPGIYMPGMFKGDQTPSAPSGQQAFMSSDEEDLSQ